MRSWVREWLSQILFHAVNEFSNQCGVAALRRRGSEVGSMGFPFHNFAGFFWKTSWNPTRKHHHLQPWGKAVAININRMLKKLKI